MYFCLVIKGVDISSDCVLCSKVVLCLDKVYLIMGVYVKCFVFMIFKKKLFWLKLYFKGWRAFYDIVLCLLVFVNI